MIKEHTLKLELTLKYQTDDISQIEPKYIPDDIKNEIDLYFKKYHIDKWGHHQSFSEPEVKILDETINSYGF